MFNLEQAISAWRREMLNAKVKTPVPLEELEAHLREHIAVLISAGRPETQAFQLAVSSLGSPGSVRIEFDKIKDAPIRPVKIGSWLWFGAIIVMAALLLRGFLLRGLFHGGPNLLLYAHVLITTAGYSAAYLIGSFGICYVCYRSFHTLSPVRQQSLSQAVRLFSHLATGLVLVGMVLAMIWSKQHWGRSWRWDPHEIGALCLSVWLIALTVMQRFGQISDRVVMLTCIGGNVVVSMAWFGAGIIASNPGRHGYGIGHYWPLAVFLGINFVFS